MMASLLTYGLGRRYALAGRVLLLAGACALALSACGSSGPQTVGMVRADVSESAYVIQLSRAVSGALPDKTAVNLPASSRWVRMGALPQGDVYRAADGPFSLPGRRGEAGFVASSGKVLGVYLPGERLYLPLSRPVALPVSMRQ